MVLISNSDTLMDEVQLFPSTLVETFPQFYSGKFVEILDSQWKSLFKIGNPDRIHRIQVTFSAKI